MKNRGGIKILKEIKPFASDFYILLSKTVFGLRQKTETK